MIMNVKFEKFYNGWMFGLHCYGHEHKDHVDRIIIVGIGLIQLTAQYKTKI
jgi:hypothetical protein